MAETAVKRRRAIEGATKDRVLDAAERVFGKYGIEAASLREIASAAGSRNHVAVQYHFGGKAGIAEAIIARRLISLERKRGALLAEARAAGRLDDPRTLLEVILRPIATETDKEGRCSYAAFLLGLSRHPELMALRVHMAETAPLTQHVVGLLRDSLPHIPEEIFVHRLIFADNVFYQCLGAVEEPLFGVGWVGRDRAIREGLTLAYAVLTAAVED